eukprot:CAMPEP_0174741502 /NCGR_PEP_ID=MMETSP1094-20130205/76498_1 /TAXON_ID=156173 /ORGANISM="Chrysochromulina brevifilum, Strain UTEX LB 985" /LENGTH=59 /DNA_ID=CAMNT_0015945403 /DNA_START=62 /DNA_END=238 /DNA_ORIENTATION=+
MEAEHCQRPDSNENFCTPNYQMETRSRVEWAFVVKGEEGLPQLGLQAYPSEADGTLGSE